MSANPTLWGTLIGNLNNIGLQDYAVSQGAPISVTDVGGLTSASVGSPLTGASGTFIVLAIVGIVAYFLFKK